MSDSIYFGIEGYDGNNNLKQVKLHKHDTDDYAVGLITHNIPHYRFNPEPLFFFNANSGIDLNVNGEFSGDSENVHNGTDTVLYTFSEPVGTKAIENSTERFNSGSKSIKWDNGTLNDIVQLDKGSDLTVSNFVALTMAINVDKEWSIPGDEVIVYGYDTGSAMQIGDSVRLQDYFNPTSFDIWQKVNIPLGDMGLLSGTIDAIRFQLAFKSGPAPTFFIDDIQFEQLGPPIEFRATKDPDKDYYVHKLRFSLADDITVLEYNKLMGLTALTNGIVFQRVQKDIVTFSASLSQMSDFWRVGSNTLNQQQGASIMFLNLEVTFTEPIILTGSATSNYISLTISDDLSGLVLFNANLLGAYKLN